jgi:macrodomain Ter protein organizer (MatP/YcbG family)
MKIDSQTLMGYFEENDKKTIKPEILKETNWKTKAMEYISDTMDYSLSSPNEIKMGEFIRKNIKEEINIIQFKTSKETISSEFYLWFSPPFF